MSGDRVQHKNSNVVWIQKNRDYLWANYAGQWIAVADEQLISAGPSPAAVREEAKRKGYPMALITGVRRQEYQGARMVR